MFFEISGVKRQILISLCLYIGPIIGGYGGSWSGPIIPKLRDLEQSPFPYYLTEAQLALVGSFAYLGAIPGPYLTTWLLNSKGRKPCLIGSAILGVIGYIFVAISKNLAMLYIGRFVTSVSFGTNTVINFVYLGEIASTNIRGLLLSIMGAMFTVGSIMVFSIAPYVSYRVSTYIPMAICVIHVFLLFTIPESPIFYAIQGKNKEMIAVLQELGRPNDAEKIISTVDEFTETNSIREWRELFTIKSNRKALFIVIVINILQHGSGVMAVLFFSAAIFDMAGSDMDSNIAMIIIGCCQLMGSAVTPLFVETAGRKKILIISSSFCTLSMFTLGLYFYLLFLGHPVVYTINWLPLVVLIIFYISYDFGLGIIPNIIMGEMFTASVRSKGSTLTLTTSWLFGFMVSTAFGAFFEVLGGHVLFWFFSCTCACAVLFTIFFVPETKGKTLLEIQQAL